MSIFDLFKKKEIDVPKKKERSICRSKDEAEIKRLFVFLISEHNFEFSKAELGDAVDASGRFFFYGPVYSYALWNGKVCINILELVQRQDYNIYITKELTQHQPTIRSGIAVDGYDCYHWEAFAAKIKKELEEKGTICGVSAL